MSKNGIRIHSHKNVIVLKSHWYNLDDGADTSIGIVLVKIVDSQVQAYIGMGRDNRNPDRNTFRVRDEQYIAKWGARVSRETAESIFGPIDNWTDKED